MKIYVYAIAKNESKFVSRWVGSMKEADGIYVLDTGSEDDTVSLLRQSGVTVQTAEILPWRFDTARNASLAMVPEDADLCVCSDLDEVFHPGWRKKLEAFYRPGITRMRYRYTWRFRDDGGEDVVFYSDKIHIRHGYQWVNPVHEVLRYDGKEKAITAYGVQVDHLPDPHKSRAQYLPLLELAVQEDPQNDRNMHYLGREYMYYGRYEEAIATLQKHLQLPTAQWRDERCASMRYIARSYAALGKLTDAYRYYLLAIGEAPYLREPWMDAARFEYRRENWLGAAYFIEYALLIRERGDSYITEGSSWNEQPYDLLSIAYYRMGHIEKAIENVKKAIQLSGEQRLKDNLDLFMRE